MDRTRIDGRWQAVWTIALVGSCLTPALLAQEPAPARPTVQSPAPQVAEVASPVATAPKFQGRLPRYYGKLVTEEQRQSIYNIQAKYYERDQALQAQLQQLRSARDAEIAKILTPAQQQSLRQLQLQARPAAAPTNDAPPAPAATASRGAALPPVPAQPR